MIMRTLTAMLFAAGIAAGQSNLSTTGVPWLGWIFDGEARALRPITGIPMSALMGDKVELDLSLAVGSPEGTFALGVAANDGRVLIVDGAGSAELVGAKVNPSRIVMSARGRVAALYFEEGNGIQIFEGLPGAGRLVQEFALDGKPGALAVDDAAGTVLASLDGGLYGYTAEQGKKLLFPSSEAMEAGFLAGSSDFVAVDGTKVILVRNGQALELTTHMTAQQDMVNPIKAAVSADGRRLVVLLKEGGVVIRDLKANTNKMLKCSCTPGELTRMSGNSVFRLNSLKDGTVWLVSGDEDEPQITFVATRGGN